MHSTLTSDLYLSLVRVDQAAGTASIQAIKQPLVWWLWFGGLMVFGGGLLAAWLAGRVRALAAEAAAAK